MTSVPHTSSSSSCVRVKPQVWVHLLQHARSDLDLRLNQHGEEGQGCTKYLDGFPPYESANIKQHLVQGQQHKGGSKAPPKIN
eukprot:5139373-Amphidinium_carterae.3